jgi:hypothetical protein
MMLLEFKKSKPYDLEKDRAAAVRAIRKRLGTEWYRDFGWEQKIESKGVSGR